VCGGNVRTSAVIVKSVFLLKSMAYAILLNLTKSVKLFGATSMIAGVFISQSKSVISF
jgi:hypothetical protein